MRMVGPFLLAFALSACGGEEGLDRADPEAVARGLVQAMARADFAQIEVLMSPEGYRTFQEDLALFQTDLGLPESPRGAFVHRIGKERLGADWPAAVAKARAGSFKAAWRLYIRIQPIPDPPELIDSRTAPANPDIVFFLYRRAGTTQQQMRLERREGLWVAERIGL
ncbi:MAG: hypothetical protein QNJ98_15360 [Planctomycetota bacterium]|nr:hypothetical protein [Planctomycetota bacterium]